MTWRVYPQFKNMLQMDDRLIALEDYVQETCRQRIGPDAESCVEEAQITGRRLVARQQGRALLFIVAPLLVYVVWRLATLRKATVAPSE